MPKKSLYRVVFFNHGKLYEVYAKQVCQPEMYGFVEISGLIFGEKSSVVVDPAEEKLKAEFEGVIRTLVPMHAVVRVDEVKKEGTAKILDADTGNVAQFPLSGYVPGGSGKRD